MNRILKQKGLSLVQIMIVVAITGVLVAVAIPNFAKYKAKSKIAEVKYQLAAALTTEKA